jgi:hypothetical protein
MKVKTNVKAGGGCCEHKCGCDGGPSIAVAVAVAAAVAVSV